MAPPLLTETARQYQVESKVVLMQAAVMPNAKWTLVQPPSAHYDTFDLAPPLGLLTLATVLEEEGVECTVCDLNLINIRGELGDEAEILQSSLEIILTGEPQVIGFTSMALESGFCLELSSRLREELPQAIIILGGPHFSSIASDVITHFPWIDYVVTGPAEETIRNFVNTKPQRRPLKPQILESINSTSPEADSLTFPALHFISIQQYFAANPRALMNYESERGCRFQCSFCYSSPHWGRTLKRKQFRRIQSELHALANLGTKHVFLVQDNVINSLEHCLELCDLFSEVRDRMAWNCYATLPQLTPALIERMAESGCTEIFMGVDAVTAGQRKTFSKAFLKSLGSLETLLRAMIDNGIRPTCAFLLDSIDNSGTSSCGDVLATALYVRRLGCGIRLNVLSLYPKTKLHLHCQNMPRRYSELKPRLLFDTPSVNYHNHFAKMHPDIFPFHSTHLSETEERTLITTAHCAYTLSSAVAECLIEYCQTNKCNPWDVSQSIAASCGDIFSCPPLERRNRELSAFHSLHSMRTDSIYNQETI